MTDAQLLDAALARFGSKQAIAKALGIAPQTVSDWTKVRRRPNGMEVIVPIPRPHRRVLTMLLGLPDETPRTSEPWHDLTWRQARARHKALQQVERLYARTGGHGRDWSVLVSILDWIVPWGENDWRALYLMETAETPRAE